jgi:hypothetical protein
MIPPLEVVLPRRVHPQPRPHLNPAGDCASCAFGGVLGVPVALVHELFETTPNVTRSRPGYRTLLYELRRRGLVAEWVEDTPMWPLGHWGGAHHGLPAYTMTQEWWRYLRMALRGGYYALASINYEGRHFAPVDHLVALCGVRERWEPVEGGHAQAIDVLVSCSARNPDGYWLEASDLVRMGGFDVVLVRPSI